MAARETESNAARSGRSLRFILAREAEGGFRQMFCKVAVSSEIVRWRRVGGLCGWVWEVLKIWVSTAMCWPFIPVDRIDSAPLSSQP